MCGEKLKKEFKYCGMENFPYNVLKGEGFNYK